MLQTLVQLRSPTSQVPTPVPGRVVQKKSIEDVSNKRELAGMKILVAEGKNPRDIFSSVNTHCPAI